MKKHWIVVTLALALVLTACGQGSTEGNKKATGEGGSAGKKVGVIQFIDQISLDAVNEGFTEEMKKLDPDVEIIPMNAQGEVATINQITQKLVQEKVDVIFAIATPAAQGALQGKGDIPLVFAAVTDPKGAGLESQSTGVTDYVDPRDQLDEYLKMFPNLKTLGTLYNTGEQNSRVQVEDLEKACKEKGLKLESQGINNINDIPQALGLLAGKIDGYFAITDNYVASAASLVTKTLNEKKIPSCSAEEGQAKNGLLMAQGVNYKESGEQAAALVHEILSDKKATDLPIEGPKNLHTVFNTKTAKLLGIEEAAYPKGDQVELIK